MDVAIYLEGGGDFTAQRAILREGMDAFLGSLKRMARERRFGWRLIPCGSRQSAFEKFSEACKNHPDHLNVLLVDAEALVHQSNPIGHLREHDGWRISAKVERVHLMAQCMEAWLAADPEAFEQFYGRDFKRAALPKRANLEEVPKRDLYRALENATAPTRKGSYAKIGHAAELLSRMDAAKSRARCPHCERFFATVGSLIGGA